MMILANGALKYSHGALSWSPGAQLFSARSSGALNPFGALNFRVQTTSGLVRNVNSGAFFFFWAREGRGGKVFLFLFFLFLCFFVLPLSQTTGFCKLVILRTVV